MSVKYKVLIINYYWPPAGGAGVQRCLKWALHLRKKGHTPIVLTVDPKKGNFPLLDTKMVEEVPADLKVVTTSTIEPFGLYKKSAGKGKIPTAGFSNESNPTVLQKFSRFIRGNCFIPDARRGWNIYAYPKAVEIIKQEKPDVILTSSPPHSTQLIGMKLRRDLGVPWIADLADAWTEIYWYKELMHLPYAKAMDAKYERLVLENSNAVITISDLLQEQFASKSKKVHKEKIAIIHNGYDEEDFAWLKSKPPKDSFTITYTGTIADIYKMDVIWQALKRVKQEFSQVQYKLRFVGEVAPGIKASIAKAGLEENAEYLNYQPHSEAVRLMMETTLLLLVIPEFKSDMGNLPGKLYEYLRAQKPIINIGPKGSESERIIAECSAGETFERSEENRLYEYLKEKSSQWLTDTDLDVKTTDQPYKHFSREAQTEQLLEVIAKVLNAKPALHQS